MKIRIKRVDQKPSPYVPYEWRCVYAVECYQSINAPADMQVIELELLWLDS